MFDIGRQFESFTQRFITRIQPQHVPFKSYLLSFHSEDGLIKIITSSNSSVLAISSTDCISSTILLEENNYVESIVL